MLHVPSSRSVGRGTPTLKIIKLCRKDLNQTPSFQYCVHKKKPFSTRNPKKFGEEFNTFNPVSIRKLYNIPNTKKT